MLPCKMHVSCFRNMVIPSVEIASFMKSEEKIDINIKLLTGFLKSSIWTKEIPRQHHKEVSTDSLLSSL